ncbi:NUDIX hydrolase domain-like protein [Lineolata rhizophorae]|uniref:NUDIX hydrolase domain-like protein n=1 Tax=Lineolata rhizophorae TaxID=578093 RepID=A0A6A6NNI8_9PEZI|nr:NUDIX hydrolase domain-like protein [Lineolata rhizophorae]
MTTAPKSPSWSVPHPRVGVGVFILNDAGQFVMGERKGSHGAGTWALPGGHLELGESFEACAAREVHEETGLRVADCVFLTATNDVMEDACKHYVTIFVGCRITGGNETPQLLEPDKCAGWEWVDWPSMRAWARLQQQYHDSSNNAIEMRKFESRPLFSPMLSLIDTRPGFAPAEAFRRNRA